jgi:branched-chain amino acid aminotransferase
MSGAVPDQSGIPVIPGPRTGWSVRTASHDDVPGLVAAFAELLSELGGTPPPAAAMEATARELIEDPRAGALLVAKGGDTIVGALGASWQIAIHAPGRYGLIQDLWVHPDRRGQAIGSDLLVALFELARARGITRIEVGLPSPRFAHLSATEAFYRSNGFSPIGLRMRRLFS